jgi:hypothetical protein
MREELKEVQANNVGLKERTFALFDPKNFSGIVGVLVQDKNPDYIEVKSGGISETGVATPGISRL